MKTVLHNGKIYIERGVFCEALLIEDGYIRAAGTNDEVFDAATKPSAEMLDAQHAAEQGRQVSEDHDAEPVGGVRFINCKGRTVVPGFNDTHMHLLQFSEFIAGVRTEDATSIDMIVERCRDFIVENPDRVKNGVHAMGWNQDLFTDEKRMLNRHDLDRIKTARSNWRRTVIRTASSRKARSTRSPTSFPSTPPKSGMTS